MNERQREREREIFTMDKDVPRSTRLWIRTVVGKKSNGLGGQRVKSEAFF